jgi:hypothetical protein
MLQEIIVWVFFSGALFYLGAHFFLQKKEKKDCAKGCGSCSSVDFNKLDKS